MNKSHVCFLLQTSSPNFLFRGFARGKNLIRRAAEVFLPFTVLYFVRIVVVGRCTVGCAAAPRAGRASRSGFERLTRSPPGILPLEVLPVSGKKEVIDLFGACAARGKSWKIRCRGDASSNTLLSTLPPPQENDGWTVENID